MVSSMSRPGFDCELVTLATSQPLIKVVRVASVPEKLKSNVALLNGIAPIAHVLLSVAAWADPARSATVASVVKILWNARAFIMSFCAGLKLVRRMWSGEATALHPLG